MLKYQGNGLSMKKIEDILNIPCRILCKEDTLIVSFDGFLMRKEGKIVFRGRTSDDIKKLHGKQRLTLYGDVQATPITLLNALIKSSSWTFGSEEYIVEIDMSELIIGRSYACGEDEIKVKKIAANITALNNMFSNRPVDLIYSFSKESPALVNFTFPTTIDASDNQGTLSIYQTIGLGWTRDNVDIPIIPCIDYTFISPSSAREAIRKIASVRNLLSFFSDYYIPLENITFSDEQSDKEGFCDCALFLNTYENIESPDRRFLISTDDFSENFNVIWRKWCKFYSNKYIPTLFYEVICNRSSRINGFLNFAQAIEIYSNHYRNEEAYQLSNKEGWNEPRLKHRIKDIAIFLNDFLQLSPEEITSFSKSLSDARNFFTHYDKGPKYTIPSAQELFAAGRVLHFMLLALVYKEISLDNSAIEKAARLFSYGSLLNDIKIVLKQTNMEQYDSMFE